MKKADVLKLNKTEFFEKLQTSEKGLSSKEAEERLLKYGKNIFENKSISAFAVFLRQFKSSLIYLLFFATIIAYCIKDFTDGTIILIILFINAFLGFYEEYKSEKIIEKLSKLVTKEVKVMRNNEYVMLDESKIVVGDVVAIQEGDILSFDARIIEAEELELNESQLTGESVPVQKFVSNDIPRETDLVYAGSIVLKGGGIGVIYATGKDTELGNIARLSVETKKTTEYEKSLQSFSSFLMKITFSGLALVFVMKLIIDRGFSNIVDLSLFVIALAVAVVPEVLPVIATITLSNGAIKLAKDKVVVKRLSSLEDLGNVNLLCTDKTGTITENKMIIKKISSKDDELFQELAYVGIVSFKIKKKKMQNSYEYALSNFLTNEIKEKTKKLKAIKEFPFDPEDRRNRVIIQNIEDNKYYLVVIGAPETLLNISTDENNQKYLEDISREGLSGLRQLGLAYKEIKYEENFDILKNENNLIFLGYASIEDPLRPTAKEAILRARKLGINVKILTGDSREVAQYTAKQIELSQDNDIIYTGDDLEKMTEEEFGKAVLGSSIFARVSPTQKFNIIKFLKDKYVVAYQGDGINDAPAMKLADVAIAVNTATDIAKASADILLLNKSLDTVINGIKYGRSIFVNINKYIKHTMVSNFGNFISLSILYLSSTTLPLLPIQILLTSLITDFPTISISSDSVDEEEIVAPEKHNVKEMIFLSLILGLPTAFFELFYFFIISFYPLNIIQTSLYLFFTFTALVVFYSVRTKKVFWKSVAPSRLLNISFLITFVLSLGIIYINSFEKWFSLTALPIVSIVWIIALTIIYFFAIDYVKVLFYKNKIAK